MAHPLFELIDQSMPAAQATLRGPASEDSLAAVAQKLGHALPHALAELYPVHDGQERGPMRSAIFEAFRWLPLAECLEQRAMYEQVANDVREEFPEASPWGAGWLPFAVDDLGNAWVVDLPSGRVFEFDHAEGEGTSLGDSADDFLIRYVASFASGERRVDPKLGAVRASTLSRPASPPISRRRRAVGIGLVALYLIAMLAFMVWLERGR